MRLLIPCALLITSSACDPREVHYYYTTTIKVEDTHCCCDTGPRTNNTGTTTVEPGGPCDEFGPSDPVSVDVDKDCIGVGLVPMDAAVEWRWPAKGAKVAGRADRVTTTPMVAPLYDSNKDGVVNELDRSSVVFTAFDDSEDYGYYNPGTLVVLNGVTGAEELFITSVSGRYFNGAGGVALGDIDDDGHPDICVAGHSVAVICVEADGTFKWATTSGTARKIGFPAIANMDGLNEAEVVFGNNIYKGSDGSRIGTGWGDPNGDGESDCGWGSSWAGAGASSSYETMTSVVSVVDIDLDGQLEVVAGNAAYEMDGSVLWCDESLNDGATAIGDFDLDGVPEVVSVAAGMVTVLDNTGVVQHQFNLVDFTNKKKTFVKGGPPTIADFDGDGYPEIGVAGSYYYAVYEVDGTVLWQTENTDSSSNMTGSSVFDFDGDGKAEVVYADEDELFILNGQNGIDRLAPSGFPSSDHTSRTLQEYPTLADVDGDGSTEIIIASYNNGDKEFAGMWQGVRSIGSVTSSWMPSRGIWNQYAYNISNINDDGSVPTNPQTNWTLWNNFRTADLSEKPGDWAPNLMIHNVEYCADCDADEVTIYGAVGNMGPADSSGFDVVVMSNGVAIAIEPVAFVGSGTSVTFGPIVIAASDWVGNLSIMADYGLMIGECDETDNEYVVGETPCP